jgi:hypothetical protein
MKIKGVILHHSVCSSINGKGYDYMITRGAVIIPASEQTDPCFIHICLEGDFGDQRQPMNSEQREQLFLLHKLVLRLSEGIGFSRNEVFPHDDSCPGAYFPWSELVISHEDGYH